jgi:hypothetical protein
MPLAVVFATMVPFVESSTTLREGKWLDEGEGSIVTSDSELHAPTRSSRTQR